MIEAGYNGDRSTDRAESASPLPRLPASRASGAGFRFSAACSTGRLIRQPACLLKACVLLQLLLLGGCSGCRPDGVDKLSREELEKRRREQRESIEMSELVTLPTDSETSILTAKPGHWHETQQRFKSNREDLQVVAVGSISRGVEPVTVPGTNTLNEFARRTSLPKGQTKTVDLQYFVPFSGKGTDDGFSTVSKKLTFRTELLSWPLMTPILQSPVLKPANELEPHEFQLVVVSPQALSYESLTVLDAVYWRGESQMMFEERTRSYYVSLVKPIDNKYPLPNSMLSMTAIAVIVWDDVAVDNLSIDQQTALIDWLHWGGQLLVSGPGSWSRLQNSFLSPYLPASTADSTEFTTEDFAELSNYWAVEDLSAPGTREPLEIVGSPVGGLKLKLNSRGQWLPHSGEMIAEAQVGRGRVVVTAFPMREPRIYRWKYYSSLVSTGMLRRHPRVVRRSGDQDLRQQYWAKPFESANNDPRLHSNLRILSRDLPLSSADLAGLGTVSLDQVGGSSAGLVSANQVLNTPAEGDAVAREDARWGGGGAAWNDYSGLGFRVIAALKSAAGIELPSRKTIILLLAGYLVCLVPLNWLFFRLLRRLEFAWVAAPVMALIGVVVVTKVARLDIGFARRTTEVSLLELHGPYARGHLTQYLAMYTSLSTNYAVEFPENGSVALPLGDIGRAQRRAVAEQKTMRTNYGSSAGVRLEPVTVYSNSTEMLHAEQLISLPGGLLMDDSDATGSTKLRNETGLDLRGALVVRRSPSGVIEKAWVGELLQAQSAALRFQPATAGELLREWSSDIATQPELPAVTAGGQGELVDSIWIGGILADVLRKTPLMPGQSRLIGYTDGRPGSLEVTPAEDQFDGRCVVVAHLTPPRLDEVTPDLNILSRPETDVIRPVELDNDASQP